MSFYPPHQHDELRLSIASNLRAVITQRLVPRADGAGPVPACEIMVSTPTIREYMMDPDKTYLLPSAMAEGMTQYGMQTFDQAVMTLLRDGLISEQDAIKNSTNPNELELKLKVISATSDRLWHAVEKTDDAPAGSGRPDWMQS